MKTIQIKKMVLTTLKDLEIKRLFFDNTNIYGDNGTVKPHSSMLLPGCFWQGFHRQKGF
jgi:hypothetical protein